MATVLAYKRPILAGEERSPRPKSQNPTPTSHFEFNLDVLRLSLATRTPALTHRCKIRRRRQTGWRVGLHLVFAEHFLFVTCWEAISIV
jgi:hypothetical protein